MQIILIGIQVLLFKKEDSVILKLVSYLARKLSYYLFNFRVYVVINLLGLKHYRYVTLILCVFIPLLKCEAMN